ncbi:MAG: hypothetical protein NZ736_03270 [Candidatus Poseidoniaceae archaeon]|nr:hypothetical protein [Candidatus Poseidoniaceae archaeon]
MPLVDGEEEPIDYELSKELESSLKKDAIGHIFDSSGNHLLLWKAVEFESWWIQFEKIIGIPMGRKMVNAATDEEEFHLLTNDEYKLSGFFKNSRRRKIIATRWLQYGWGELNFNENHITTPTLAPFSVGVALAAIEYCKQKRFKITWTQPNSVLIALDLVEELREISPSKQVTEFTWTKNCNDNYSTMLEVGEFQVVRKNGGWDFEGERMVFIPANILTRLLFTTQSRALTIGDELSSAIKFVGIEEAEKSTFLCTALSMVNVIEQSERPIYILSDSEWINKCQYLLGRFGFVCPNEVSSLKENGAVKFSFYHSPTLPFSVGALMAFWQRAHGRLAKVTIMFQDVLCIVEISSKLEYN